MSIASRRKKKDRVAAAKAANKRQPTVGETYRTRMVANIMAYLYNKQYMFWQGKLKALTIDNQLSYGHTNPDMRYAIAWGSKIYSPTDWTDRNRKEYCLPLNPRKPDLAKRMEEVAEELDDLDEERYEVERFLTNLFSFEAPPKRIKKILGPTIARALDQIIDKYMANFSDHDWTMNGNNEFAMKTFVEANKETIVLMNQRVMINMTTL